MSEKGAKLAVRTAVIIILLLIALSFSVWLATRVEAFSTKQIKLVMSDFFGLLSP